MAPFLPFLSEAIYRNLTATAAGAPKSVHLCDYPEADATRRSEALEAKMATVRDVVSMGRALRSRFTIKTRQPLAQITIVVRDARRRELIGDLAELVSEELNVKNVILSGDEEAVVSVSCKADFRRLGKVFGPSMKEAAAQIATLSAADITLLENGGKKTVLGKEISFEDLDLRREKREGVEVETGDGITVALDTRLSPELIAEGHAREFVNRVQSLRKERGLEVSDRIRIHAGCANVLKTALESHRAYICAETLAVVIDWTASADGVPEEINGMSVSLGIVKAG